MIYSYFACYGEAAKIRNSAPKLERYSMLETFYNNFGFVGSILIAFGGFILFIFWIAGISGIAQLPDNRTKNLRLALCVLFPPFPIFWLLYDMYAQKKMMEETDV